jgi:hypothetical protein
LAKTACRIFALGSLNVLALWFPLIREIISHQIKVGSQLIIAIDRSQWQENNVLMVSAIIQKRAFPIFWTLLDKKGSCNLAEQKQVLRPVIRLLNKYKLVVVGDREFHSIELAQWGSIPLWQIYPNRQNTIKTIKQTVEGKP